MMQLANKQSGSGALLAANLDWRNCLGRKPRACAELLAVAEPAWDQQSSDCSRHGQHEVACRFSRGRARSIDAPGARSVRRPAQSELPAARPRLRKSGTLPGQSSGQATDAPGDEQEESQPAAHQLVGGEQAGRVDGIRLGEVGEAALKRPEVAAGESARVRRAERCDEQLLASVHSETATDEGSDDWHDPVHRGPCSPRVQPQTDDLECQREHKTSDGPRSMFRSGRARGRLPARWPRRATTWARRRSATVRRRPDRKAAV